MTYVVADGSIISGRECRFRLGALEGKQKMREFCFDKRRERRNPKEGWK